MDEEVLLVFRDTWMGKEQALTKLIYRIALWIIRTFVTDTYDPINC